MASEDPGIRGVLTTYCSAEQRPRMLDEIEKTRIARSSDPARARDDAEWPERSSTWQVR